MKTLVFYYAFTIKIPKILNLSLVLDGGFEKHSGFKLVSMIPFFLR